MDHIALYRKYRPQTFDDVTGQDPIVQTLRNEVIADRIANAYLFCGPRGTGKTSVSRIFAHAINCDNPVNGNPCCQCNNCKGNNIDLTEIDAASNNNVDSIRALTEEASYACQSGKYRVYIIDEVHMLTGSSFNALLKTLEEPPKNTIFILATTEKIKVPPTIASRCQQFDFKNMKEEDCINRLKYICAQENITYESNEELKLIYKISDGAMRDAVSYLDECAFMNNSHLELRNMKDLLGQVQDEIIIDIADCIEKEDVPGLIDIVHNLHYEGKSLSYVCRCMYNHYRDHILDFENDKDKFEINMRRMRNFAELEREVKDSTTLMEIGMIRICKPQMESDYSSIIERLNRLENGTVIQNNVSKEEEELEYIRVTGYNINARCNTFLV